MIITTSFEDKQVIVLGLGKSGLSAAHALKVGGAHVRVWDDNEKRRLAVEGFSLKDPRTVQWRDYDALILSPGIPFTHPEPHPAVKLAQEAGRPVVGDAEIFAKTRLAAKVIGITGTNGKSTTTALVGHILSFAKRPSAVGGNIGYPLLDLPPLGRDGFYCLELSSFQIDLAPSLSVDVGVLLNLSQDHLDRHGTMEQYADVKTKLMKQQGMTAFSIIGIDDPYSAGIAKSLQAEGRRVIGISTREKVDDGVYVKDGRLIDSIHGVPREVLNLNDLFRLPGAHNWQNIAAAYAAVRAAGLGTSESAEAIISFPGLPHRQEYITTHHNVRFVNDSKATNIDATLMALKSHKNIFWIVGGRAKSNGLEGVESCLDQIVEAFTIGEVTEAFASYLDERGVRVQTCGSLNVAIQRAYQSAQAAASAEGPATILLSPACASFDQFKNFEERGERYRSLAHAIINKGVNNRYKAPDKGAQL